MANKLTALRFDQAANLVDDPANPKAVITLFKRVTTKGQPGVGQTHVDTTDWLKKEADYFRGKQASRDLARAADADYLTTKRKGWA